jgi:transcriptional regulator with XRE-family HTH domain
MLKLRGISQVQLAARLDLSAQAVSKWVKGGEIEHARLLGLAKILKVNWIWLRYGDDAVVECLNQVGLSQETVDNCLKRDCPLRIIVTKK